MSDTLPDSPPAARGSVFTRKLFRVPVWVWAIVIIAIAGAYAWWRNKYTVAGQTQDPDGNTDSDPTTDEVDSTDYSGDTTTGTVTTAYTTYDGTVAAGTTAYTSNASWGAAVANSMGAAGQYSSGAISTAISRYLNGKGLTTVEKAIINSALAQYGTPPEGVLPIVDVATPAKTVTKPTVTYLYYTSREGDTVMSVSHRLYGTQGTKNDLLKDNPGLPVKGAIRKGTRIKYRKVI